MVMEKVFHEKISEERIFFPSGTNILRNKYTLTYTAI
jgi:hypothetical protein